MSRKHLEFNKLRDNILSWKKRGSKWEDYLLNNWSTTIEIIQLTQKYSKNGLVKDMARKNAIVNFVSSIELFSKGVILSRKWDNDRLNKLLTDRKIELTQAYEFFTSNKKITKEHLLIADYSFSSFDDIRKIFTALIGKDFVDELNSYSKNNSNEWFLLNSKDKWISRLARLYFLRNKIIHENYPQPVKKIEFEQLQETTFFFINTMSQYFKILFKDKPQKTAKINL